MLKKNVRKYLKNKATFNLFLRHYTKNRLKMHITDIKV